MKYDTNLASEFYILSALYRKGLDAFITLGNKKSVDIIVKNRNRQITIDVKGLQGTTGFPVDNVDTSGKPDHYVIFISFKNKIDDLLTLPEIYIVPSKEVKKITYQSPNSIRRVVSLSTLRKREKKYRDNWDCLRN